MNAHTATRRAVLTALPAMAYIDPRGFAVFSDPVYAAMERHRRAYDTLMDEWAQTRGGLLLEDEAAKRNWYDVGTAEEESFHAVLATKPTTRAGAIACVRARGGYRPCDRRSQRLADDAAGLAAGGVGPMEPSVNLLR